MVAFIWLKSASVATLLVSSVLDLVNGSNLDVRPMPWVVNLGAVRWPYSVLQWLARIG